MVELYLPKKNIKLFDFFRKHIWLNIHLTDKLAICFLLGFIQGWSVGLKCLSRQLVYRGAIPQQFTSVSYDAHETMITALHNKEVNSLSQLSLKYIKQ